MKTFFLSLAFLLVGTFSLANDGLNNNPIIKQFAISNYEVLNIDTGEFLFKKNNCDDGGYSFFSPFNSNPELLETSFQSRIENDNEVVLTTNTDGIASKYIINNFKEVENGSKVTFDINIGNTVFNSQITGSNLTVESVKQFLGSTNDQVIISKLCPPCVYVAVVAVTAAVTKICTNASSACGNCNGKLEVSACSCSCTPIQK